MNFTTNRSTSTTTPRGYKYFLLAILLLFVSGAAPVDVAESDEQTNDTYSVADSAVQNALQRSGDNRSELEDALDRVEDHQTTGMRFLIAHMPERDLKTLSADFLVRHTEYAYRAWREAPWHDRISEELFLNQILPYANLNEKRSRWRKGFYEKFKPLVKEVESPGKAATVLNRKVFDRLGVTYSKERNKPHQNPSESIEIGKASCTGLSIILVDACRAVGIPARVVGTPLWSDRSGNHTWVEVWDDGWHFTGAAEPKGDQLDEAWFTGRARKAKMNEPLHAIYAVSFRETPLHFPMVWAPRDRSVNAVNVTARYKKQGDELPDDLVRLSFVVRDPDTDKRVRTELIIQNQQGVQVFSGRTKGPHADINNHLNVPLQKGSTYQLKLKREGKQLTRQITASADKEVLEFTLDQLN